MSNTKILMIMILIKFYNECRSIKDKLIFAFLVHLKSFRKVCVLMTPPPFSDEHSIFKVHLLRWMSGVEVVTLESKGKDSTERPLAGNDNIFTIKFSVLL